jgi:hypothetical protein
MMLYPGLTLDEKVSFQTFRNYYDFVAKRMGCTTGDADVRTHFRYVVDKVKFMQKSKRYQKKFDLYITHDRSKAGKKFGEAVVNAIRSSTPNLRIALCTEKRFAEVGDERSFANREAAASSLNVCVLAMPQIFQHDEVKHEIMAAYKEGARMLVLTDVRSSPRSCRTSRHRLPRSRKHSRALQSSRFRQRQLELR